MVPMTVTEYREAMIADDWSHKSTYNSESEGSACSLTKDGWKASITNRERDKSICIWGPDRLQIIVPEIYSMDALVRALRICTNCLEADVDTQQYSFAGRCCAKCRPELAKKHEFPGWTN